MELVFIPPPLHVADNRLAAFVDVGLARVPDVCGASLGLPASWQQAVGAVKAISRSDRGKLDIGP